MKKTLKKMTDLQEEFNKAAREIVKVIVLEDCLSEELKTIRPVSDEFGGMAGGTSSTSPSL
jgi:hypothetical protein